MSRGSILESLLGSCLGTWLSSLTWDRPAHGLQQEVPGKALLRVGSLHPGWCHLVVSLRSGLSLHMSAPPKCAVTRLCTQLPVSRVGAPLSPLATTPSHLPIALSPLTKAFWLHNPPCAQMWAVGHSGPLGAALDGVGSQGKFGAAGWWTSIRQSGLSHSGVRPPPGVFPGWHDASHLSLPSSAWRYVTRHPRLPSLDTHPRKRGPAHPATLTATWTFSFLEGRRNPGSCQSWFSGPFFSAFLRTQRFDHLRGFLGTCGSTSFPAS